MFLGNLVPIVMFLTVPATLLGWPIARAFARRIDRERAAPRLDSDANAQLQRMEHAIESIAIEVERIAEGQRFTTRLLSDRVDTAVSGSGRAS